MDRVCFVVNKRHDDKSVPKLVERIRELGLECICSEVTLSGYFTVGWGGAAIALGKSRGFTSLRAAWHTRDANHYPPPDAATTAVVDRRGPLVGPYIGIEQITFEDWPPEQRPT
jgi:hypothetical protein